MKNPKRRDQHLLEREGTTITIILSLDKRRVNFHVLESIIETTMIKTMSQKNQMEDDPTTVGNTIPHQMEKRPHCPKGVV